MKSLVHYCATVAAVTVICMSPVARARQGANFDTRPGKKDGRWM
jgi:hypothetical protein